MKRRERNQKFAQKEQGPVLVAKTEKQKEYIRSVHENDMTVVLGPAGTGKTFVAAAMAAQWYSRGHVNKIYLTRPNVAAGRSIGFFPGTLEEKMAPWVAPYTDVMRQFLGSAVFDLALSKGNIQIVPFETMRGRSFSNAFVLLDEAQNTTPEEMKMFVTRIGENSRVIVNGDVRQSDLGSTSGLTKIISMAYRYQLPVPVIEFGVDDIVRSDLCKMWITAWMEEDSVRK